MSLSCDHWNSVLKVFCVAQSPSPHQPVSQVKSDFPSARESELWAAEDLNIIGPLASRIPTAKSGISLGPFVELMARSGEGADPASFKWALKTGHFYRFIRTFRTSWVLLGAQCEALAHHSLHQNPAWEKLIYFSSFSLQRLYKFMTFIHLLYLFKVFQKRWNDFKS